jgi:hypothetical protein
MVGGLTAIRRDVLPYTVVYGSPPRLRSLNYAQLWPVLGFAARRVALALFHLLFPSPRPVGTGARSVSRPRPCPLPLTLPTLPSTVSTRDRLDALDAVLETLVRDAGTPGRASAPVCAQVDVVARVFRDMSQFAREAEGRRGIYVPSAG